MGDCPLCRPKGETVLWQDARLRIILASEPDYPAFCRVIWKTHVKEMTDLAEADSSHLLRAVLVVEQLLREMLRPDKINLASLGNQVPHLHWHVIPRFVDDAHFPDPVWTARKREGRAYVINEQQLREALMVALDVAHG